MKISVTKLSQVLKTFGYKINDWKKDPTTKTIKQLAEEINSGESWLEITKDGLIRKMKRVEMHIYFATSSDVLVEEKQILPNGVERKVERLPSGKMIGNEDRRTALHREMFEELELPEETYKEFFLRTVENNRVSKVYPGLRTSEEVHVFDVVLKLGVNPKLKITDKDGKILCFRWDNPARFIKY